MIQELFIFKPCQPCFGGNRSCFNNKTKANWFVNPGFELWIENNIISRNLTHQLDIAFPEDYMLSNDEFIGPGFYGRWHSSTENSSGSLLGPSLSGGGFIRGTYSTVSVRCIKSK